MASKSAISHACRITLFTRVNCSLCTTARDVLDKVRQRRPFQFRQFDVMEPENSKWKIYEFDVPVVCSILSMLLLTGLISISVDPR